MFHVHFQVAMEKLEPVLLNIYTQTGVGLTQHLREISGTSCYFETNIGDQYACVPQEAIKSAFHMLDQAMKKLTNEGVENK